MARCPQCLSRSARGPSVLQSASICNLPRRTTHNRITRAEIALIPGAPEGRALRHFSCTFRTC
eukprot:8379903-Alexandrium_andersonii.AAC.1